MESDSSWVQGWLDGRYSFSDLNPRDVRPLLEEVADQVLDRRRRSWAWAGPATDGLYWLEVQESGTSCNTRYAVRARSVREGLVEVLLRELGAEETHCRDDLTNLEDVLFLERRYGSAPALSGRWDV